MPELRVRALNDRPVRADGDYVLYWMVAARRIEWSFALDRAIDWARALQRPLLIFEPLACDYPHASLRLHRFVLEGMADTAQRLRRSGVGYFPYVEPEPKAGRGLLETLGRRACAIVTDDFPCFWIPSITAAGAERASVSMEAIDSNGLLPLRAGDRLYPTARGFRSFLRRELQAHLARTPSAHPLSRLSLPKLRTPLETLQRWSAPTPQDYLDGRVRLESLPIDRIGSVESHGGHTAARARWRRFVRNQLSDYAELRNHPDADATSGMSPYLHFGHISAHELVVDLRRYAASAPAKNLPHVKPIEKKSSSAHDTRTEAHDDLLGIGSRAGAFLDELVTWRELGFNFCVKRPDYASFGSLPPWAMATLRKHARDRRSPVYDLSQLEAAQTHDPLWNAAQRQLRSEGRIHGYLRMLWGKKVLEWSPTPETAHAWLIHLNDRWALDGRDPNSYSGIGWIFGRYDRAWGPERPIFGVVRYMSSASTERKLRVRRYLERFAENRCSI